MFIKTVNAGRVRTFLACAVECNIAFGRMEWKCSRSQTVFHFAITDVNPLIYVNKSSEYFTRGQWGKYSHPDLTLKILCLRQVSAIVIYF